MGQKGPVFVNKVAFAGFTQGDLQYDCDDVVGSHGS